MEDRSGHSVPTVHVVDDDASVRKSLCWLLESAALRTREFASAESFLNAFDSNWIGCILLDVRMPGMSGLKLQEQLQRRGNVMPIVILTGHANVTMAITAMKHGAFDFLNKPYRDDMLLDSVNKALAHSAEKEDELRTKFRAQALVAGLTSRELEVMRLVVDGLQNKSIAEELEISEKTVEAHRSRVMQKMEARSLSELVRIALIASN